MSATKTVPAPAERIYARNPDTATRTIAGETFIIAIRGELASLENMYVLDEVGVLIWNGLDGKRDLAALVAQITDTFEVEPDTALQDAEAFLEELRERKLVHLVGEEEA